MKQILQHLNNGHTEIADVPAPQVQSGHLLIQTTLSLISSGTERMVLDFSQGNWLFKARQQPEKVRQVLEKIKTDGLLPTLEAIKTKLDQPLPLGYCNVGKIIAVGNGVENFKVGDRVVSNGHHAEIVCVPKLLCAKIPDDVSDESALFTVLGAIALQGIRLAQPTLGETFVVIGLGLVGLLTVQLLRANGCRVIGVDPSPARLKQAEQYGAHTCSEILELTQNRGVDGVLITAATKSNEPVHQAAQMCRKRGRIILVGLTGLELSRADFYEKELSFQVSCSYGPGRYDSHYEQGGHDYPIGFVRWTEERNFCAILQMLQDDRITTTSLISQRYPITEAILAYEALNDPNNLGILLEYPVDGAPIEPVTRISYSAIPSAEKVVLGVIGAGNYGSRVLIPAFSKSNIRFHTAVSRNGVTAQWIARKFNFLLASTDIKTIFNNAAINAVAVITPHDTHADYVIEALNTGKHVFVEKPLAMTFEQIDLIEKTYHALSRPLVLMVGFNRRFAPQILTIKELLNTTKAPKTLVMTINAGLLPSNHWVLDPEKGGGRLLAEACHFIDLLRYLVGDTIVNYHLDTTRQASQPSFTITLTFADGSLGSIHYITSGHKHVSKERLEIFVASKYLLLDNFRRLTGYGWGLIKNRRLFKQNKGQIACVKAFVGAIAEGKASPIAFNEILEVAKICVALAKN